MNISSLNTALRAFKGKSSFIIQESSGIITITKLDFQKKIVNKIISQNLKMPKINFFQIENTHTQKTNQNLFFLLQIQKQAKKILSLLYPF